MAEQLLREKLALHEASNVQVSSAGVQAIEGADLDGGAKQVLEAHGHSFEHHVARQLTADIAADADLILTATGDHRTDVIRTLVRANRYTFTLKEFVNLASFKFDLESEDGAEPKIQAKSLADKLADTVSARGYAVELADADIADPYQLGQAAFESTLNELDPLITKVAEWANHV